MQKIVYMPVKDNSTYIYQNLLDKIETVSLLELDKVKLQDRQDTKFVFNQCQLPLILEKIKPFYKILEINNDRIFTYNTTYYDTDDFRFYIQHHNGERKRFKVRFRKYSSNEKSFFEIKIKNNKNRTVKKRLLVDNVKNDLGAKESNMVSEIIKLSPNQLTPKIDMEFLRITLTDNSFNERLTIDTNLYAKNGSSSKIFNKLVISEIKQKKYNPKSEFIKILHDLNIQEMRFSKYCMGMLHVNNKIKYNRFKSKLLQINKILTETKLSMREKHGIIN